MSKVQGGLDCRVPQQAVSAVASGRNSSRLAMVIADSRNDPVPPAIGTS